MPALFKPAPEVAEIARQLITRVVQHQELVNVHIEYLFLEQAQKSGGRTVLGRARKITGLNAWLAAPGKRPKGFSLPEEFFVIDIAHDKWVQMDDNQRVALVDHELSHCGWHLNDEDMPVLTIRQHDVEEFIGVLSRNGLWKEDVQQLGIVASEQLSLALDRIPAQAEGAHVAPELHDFVDAIADTAGLDSVTITSSRTGKSVKISKDRT